MNPNWAQMAPPFEQFTMENEHLLVEFDFADRRREDLAGQGGVNLAGAADPLGVLEFAVERPGPMTAWVTYPCSSRAGAGDVRDSRADRPIRRQCGRKGPRGPAK